MKKWNKILQDALLKSNVLSKGDVQDYLTNAEDNNLSLKEYLLENDIVTDSQILGALSQFLNIESISFANIAVDQAVVDKIPIKIAWYYKVMPLSLENNVLTVASSDPIDVKVQDEIRMHLGHDVVVKLAGQCDLMEAFKKYYGFASDTIDRIMVKQPIQKKISSGDTGQWIEDLEQETNDPTVSNLVNQIILEAYKKRATDIHIEPYRNKVRFRYRIDGVLVDANLPDKVKHFLPPILSRIKILANLSITEKRLPQDGSAVVKTSDQQLDLRISTMPTPRGESMVIRILPTKVRLLSLEKLGFTNESVQKFRDLIKNPHGVLFITGPTGSGKTTTLYACLSEINSWERKIITIEDPVEYEMEGVTQIQVNPKVDFHFSTGLRSVLRHDPDIIMVGEVRDLETAEIAIRTALTGHLVFSTLHTNDSASGITRLIDMGVEPYLVASSVEAFVAQRLIRVICPRCKEEDPTISSKIREEIQQSLKLNSLDDVKVYRGAGCDHCNQTGFYGRNAIYEILTLNDTIRAAILEKPRSDYIKQIAMREGLVTLRQSAWQAVVSGITTPNEVMHVTARDEVEESQVKEEQIIEQDEAVKEEQPSVEVSPKISSSQADQWTSKNQMESRSYPRVDIGVEIRYRRLKRDPKDSKFLISDGVEHPTLTKNVSAAGICFVSKELLSIGSILELKIQLGQGAKSH